MRKPVMRKLLDVVHHAVQMPLRVDLLLPTNKGAVFKLFPAKASNAQVPLNAGNAIASDRTRFPRK